MNVERMDFAAASVAATQAPPDVAAKLFGL